MSGVLSVAAKLDYESSASYRLLLAARDAGCPALETLSTVTVHLVDVDDRKLRFEQNNYEVFLAEDVPRGSFVVQLQAAVDDLSE